MLRRMGRNALVTLRAVPLLLLLMLLVLLPASGGCRGKAVSRSTSHFPAGTGFVRHELDIDGTPHPLWVFLPKNYDASKSYPTIVFLHGLFEAGADGSNALSAGLGPVIARDPDAWPFIVLFPQSSGTWRGPRRERLVMRSLDWAQQHYAVDRARVILAGLSYGGLGAWQIGARHPDRFAALVPVSGPRDLACADELVGMPVWAFHNRGDPIIDSDGSEQMCAQIAQLGGRARYTAFDRIGHDCWDRAVADTDLVEWMLRQQQRSSAEVVSVSSTE